VAKVALTTAAVSLSAQQRDTTPTFTLAAAQRRLRRPAPRTTNRGRHPAPGSI